MKTKRLLLLVSSVVFATVAMFAQTPECDKVAKYHFPDNLQEQIEALEHNPMLQQYATMRKELDNQDRWRPDYHFSAPDGKLNDPNGLCFWQGRWHMFYQAYPVERDRKVPHWGHAVSDDLIHWKDLPLALYPDADDQKVYSGTTLVESDRVIAIHHTPKYGNYLAISSDPLLLNWERLEEPVVSFPANGENVPYKVFDPCIWKEGGYYYALSGSREEGIGKIRRPVEYLFRSKDLKEWTYMHPFVEHDQFFTSNDDGACPYFWPIGSTGKHILLSFSHYSGGHYLLGTYDTRRQKFEAYDGGGFNHGPTGRGGLHAPSATPDPNSDGVVVIFNMKRGTVARNGAGFNEIMTLPRLLSLDEYDQLVERPYGDYASLRGEYKSLTNFVVGANEEVVLPGIEGNVAELVLEIDMKKCRTLEVDILRSPNKEEYTRIVVMREAGYPNTARTSKRKIRPSTIMLDASCSSSSELVNTRQPDVVDFFLEKGEILKLHIFVDRSVVEVFANERRSLTMRAYPALDESRLVSIRAAGYPVEVVKAEAWQLGSIYEHKTHGY